MPYDFKRKHEEPCCDMENLKTLETIQSIFLDFRAWRSIEDEMRLVGRSETSRNE